MPNAGTMPLANDAITAALPTPRRSIVIDNIPFAGLIGTIRQRLSGGSSVAAEVRPPRSRPASCANVRRSDGQESAEPSRPLHQDDGQRRGQADLVRHEDEDAGFQSEP